MSGAAFLSDRLARVAGDRRTTAASVSRSVVQNVIVFRPRSERLTLPDLCCDIQVVNDALYFTGPMTRAAVSPHVDRDVLLFRISVATARQLIGAPTSELTDRVVPLDEVSPSLNRRVANALEARRFDDLAFPAAHTGDVRFLVAARALSYGTTVLAAAEMVALSERQLGRLFFDRAGVTPKMFGRIARFRRAIFAAKAGTPLPDVAVTHGYADQSHFARDVHAFTGRSWRSLRDFFGDVGFVQDTDRLAGVGCE